MPDHRLLRIIRDAQKRRIALWIVLEPDGFWAACPMSVEVLADEEADPVIGAGLMKLYRDAKKGVHEQSI